MSALARYFMSKGKEVAGYDRVRTSLTDALVKEGARIHFTEEVDMVKKGFGNPKETLVVFTPAVPSDHPELAYFSESGFTVLKRSEVLGRLTEHNKCIAFAGTHGKTTISTLIAHLLKTADIPCTAFLGGISKNYQTNALLDKNSEWIVVEADEFDRSFLRLHPDRAIITSCDPDHLDIYGDIAELQSSFRQFISQVKKNGNILIRKDVKFLSADKYDGIIYSYSPDPGADFSVSHLELREGMYHFDLQTPDGLLSGLTTILPGLVNVENAIAAAAMGYIMGLDAAVIRQAISTYMGVKRRFDIQINRRDLVYIDDYAHHPKELESFIGSVRALYPGRKITGVFQPHLYTRTRDFADGFAISLSELDELILMDIYPAREPPLPGITSELIFTKVMSGKKTLCSGEALLEELEKRQPDVLITMGAGDIDQFVEPIKALFS